MLSDTETHRQARTRSLRGTVEESEHVPQTRPSATGMPSVPCFRMNAFWASENRDAFIALRSSQPGNRRGKIYLKTIQRGGLRSAVGPGYHRHLCGGRRLRMSGGQSGRSNTTKSFGLPEYQRCDSTINSHAAQSCDVGAGLCSRKPSLIACLIPSSINVLATSGTLVP